jgi:hypothetical protein
LYRELPAGPRKFVTSSIVNLFAQNNMLLVDFRAIRWRPSCRLRRRLHSDLCGVNRLKANRNFVTSVEGGKENICLDNILRLARALKTNPAELFALYSQQKSNPRPKVAEKAAPKAT